MTNSTMDFYAALKLAYAGKRIYKLEWNDKNSWGQLWGGKLCLHLPDGLYHPWIISDGDMAGTDWTFLPDIIDHLPTPA